MGNAQKKQEVVLHKTPPEPVKAPIEVKRGYSSGTLCSSYFRDANLGESSDNCLHLTEAQFVRRQILHGRNL